MQLVSNVTTDNWTLIDHIYTNLPQSQVSSHILETYFSDHKAVCALITVKPDVRFRAILQHCCQSENIHWLVQFSNYQSVWPNCNCIFQYSAQILLQITKSLICSYPDRTARMTTSLPTRERIIASWAEGESNNNIATRFGITRHMVLNIVRNMMERGHLLDIKPGGKQREIEI